MRRSSGGLGFPRVESFQHAAPILDRDRTRIFGLHFGREHLDHLAALDPQFDHAKYPATAAIFGRPAFALGDSEHRRLVEMGRDRAMRRGMRDLAGAP